PANSLISHPVNSAPAPSPLTHAAATAPAISLPPNTHPSNSHPANFHPANSPHVNSNPENSHYVFPTASSSVPISTIFFDLPLISYSQSAANSHHCLTRFKTKAQQSFSSSLLTHTSHVSSVAIHVPDLDIHEPSSHSAAAHNPRWLAAMKEEY
ncbi:hypothetical protein U1Q18_027837, partial [Sarracenia purpurea var. burkii]